MRKCHKLPIGAMPDHVTRPETLELIERLNELERIIPIFRQALELIAHANGGGPWATTADRALREAFRDEP